MSYLTVAEAYKEVCHCAGLGMFCKKFLDIQHAYSTNFPIRMYREPNLINGSPDSMSKSKQLSCASCLSVYL